MLADLNLELNPTTLIAAALTVMGTLAAGLRLAWTWLTGLVDRFQAEATAARKEFLEEAKTARQEFMGAIDKLEDRRAASEDRLTQHQADMHQALLGIQTILTERGVPAPQGAATK